MDNIPRPPGLPERDARTPDSEARARVMVSGDYGLLETPTPEMRARMESTLRRAIVARRKYADGEGPCGHPGCLHHISHPCEGCGRIAGRVPKDGNVVQPPENGGLQNG